MIRQSVIWAIVGFCVPIFWGVMSFIFFTAPNSVWTDLSLKLVYITCPPWVLPENGASWLITPLANAVLYGCVALIIFASARELRRPVLTHCNRGNLLRAIQHAKAP